MKPNVRTILLAMVMCLALAQPATAEKRKVPAPPVSDKSTVDSFREQYDVMMSGFELLLGEQGKNDLVERVRGGRETMRTLTDKQLAYAFSRSGVPDLSAALQASLNLVESRRQQKTAGLPTADPIVSNCNGVDITPGTRYALFIIKEVANSVLAAAAWACNEDILGENGSAACIPLAIAADVANGFFDAATFCAGEVTANQVDANYRRLEHIHDDLAGASADIINNANANTTSIINQDNANATTIVNTDNANATTIVNNDNANAASIISNDNANTAAILSNANANKNELRDLILRTQIEQDLSTPDSSAVVVIFELPTANGGYLDLVTTIVTQTIANVQAAGGSVGNASSFLNTANAAKAAGDFKTAYANYRKAYKAAGK